MIYMKIAPAPSEGLTKEISDTLKKNIGIGKNILDISCVGLAAIFDLAFHGKLLSVGLGTVFAMLLLGRVMAVIDWTLGDKIQMLTGLSTSKNEIK